MQMAPVVAGIIALGLLVIALLACLRHFDGEQKRNLVFWVVLASLTAAPAMAANMVEGRAFVLPALAFSSVAALLIKGLLVTRERWSQRFKDLLRPA